VPILSALVLTATAAFAAVTVAPTAHAAAARQAERLDRGLISVPSGSGNLVSWRLLGTDPQDVSFNVYRGSTKLNASPITNSTNYLDSGSGSYTVRAVVGGVEQAASPAALQLTNGYLSVPMSSPGSSYSASDSSVGDLDGDGQLELVVKWEPSNSKDNSQSGVTDVVYLDGYKLNGTRLWRINLGINIGPGPTTPSSRCMTTTVMARPRSRSRPPTALWTAPAR
jgi:hypothetical protein